MSRAAAAASPPAKGSTFSAGGRAPGIDRFRILAALMVVAIHTGPLSSFSPTADFLVTYCLGRVGVPFFFMVTGYFVLGPLFSGAPKQSEETGAPFFSVRRHLKKMALIYGLSSLLYLPVAFYAGHTEDWRTLFALLRVILFDGCFYHLWYLPASILGTILLLCARRFKPGVLLALTFTLYLIGLGGDSYYGLIAGIPAAEAFYQFLFSVSSYTRNGVFFAPLFLAMGALLAGRKPPKCSGLPLLLSLCLLTAEGLITYRLQLQRHNSMYLFLVPTMYFLFSWLLTLQGKSHPKLPSLALWIYLIHPFCILVVRQLAKMCRLTWLLVEFSPVYFLAVALVSVLAALIACAAASLAKRKSGSARR